MHLVLNKVVDQRNKGAEEETGKNLSVLNSPTVVWAQGQTTNSPWQSRNQVRDHKDIVPIMVIRRCNICPSTAGKSPKQSNTGNKLGERRVGAGSHEIPEEDEGESRAGRDGNEDLEERTLRIPIANGC